jgi:hypothetical protein
MGVRWLVLIAPCCCPEIPYQICMTTSTFTACCMNILYVRAYSTDLEYGSGNWGEWQEQV